jgi:hypothetical protein
LHSAITAAITMSLGAAALSAGFTTPALAATAKSIKAQDGKDPQNYDKCLGLARERGFRPDTETSSGLMMFVDGCIMGKQR